MQDTFESIWGEVHGHSLAVDPLLIQSWVRDTWREVGEARTWSWLRRRGTITCPLPYTTGTFAASPGDPTITFTGATLTLSMIGLQFRSGSTSGSSGGGSNGVIYEITNVDIGAGTVQVYPPWCDTSSAVTGQSFKIFTAYITAPDPQFFSWLGVIDPSRRKRLRLHINNETIDYYDATRSMATGSRGGPACLSGLDWSRSFSGRVYPTLQVNGSGPSPSATGSYTGQTESLVVVKITTGGLPDVAVFSWRIDTQSTITGTVASSAGNTLPNGVTLSWPTSALVVNDVFVVRVSPRPLYGSPRYELYPHPTTAMTLPCTYSVRVQDIDESGFTLPYTMRGDVVKCGALAKMARYPGTNQNPNPFSQIARAQMLEDKFQWMLGGLVTADDYIMETNVMDQTDQYELALLPWMSTSGTGMRPTQDFDPLDLLMP